MSGPPAGGRLPRDRRCPAQLLEEGLRETGEPSELPPGWPARPEERAWTGTVMTSPGWGGGGRLVQKGPCPLEEALRFTNEETEAEGS